MNYDYFWRSWGVADAVEPELRLPCPEFPSHCNSSSDYGVICVEIGAIPPDYSVLGLEPSLWVGTGTSVPAVPRFRQFVQKTEPDEAETMANSISPRPLSQLGCLELIC
jgi:hypothetical protein